MQLTDKEKQMLAAFIEEGVECNGAETIEELKNDNMTCMSASDLKSVLGWSKQSIGGVMGSLSEKGLIADSGDSSRGAKDTDWYATDKGIDIGWEFL